MGEFGAAAAFAADEGRDGLDDFAGLDLFGEGGRDGGEERDFARSAEARTATPCQRVLSASARSGR